MTKQDAVDFFGSDSELARRLHIGRSAVSQWEEIPEGRQYQIEILTKGKLKADRPELRETAS